MSRKCATAVFTEQAIFAKRLSEAMKLRGFNHTTLAEKIRTDFGITVQRQTISQYANGQSKPNTDTLMLLCGALGVSADYLLGFKKAPTTEPIMQDICEYTGLSEQAVFILHNSAFTSKWINSLTAGQRTNGLGETGQSTAFIDIAIAFAELDQKTALALVDAVKEDSSSVSAQISRQNVELALYHLTKAVERAADIVYNTKAVLDALAEKESKAFAEELRQYAEEANDGEHQEN